MTKMEFDGWMVYLMNKGPTVDEIQMAVLSSLVSNGLGSKRTVDDFLITKKATKKTKTEDVTEGVGMDKQAVRAAFAGVAVPMK